MPNLKTPYCWNTCYNPPEIKEDTQYDRTTSLSAVTSTSEEPTAYANYRKATHLNIDPYTNVPPEDIDHNINRLNAKDTTLPFYFGRAYDKFVKCEELEGSTEALYTFPAVKREAVYLPDSLQHFPTQTLMSVHGVVVNDQASARTDDRCIDPGLLLKTPDFCDAVPYDLTTIEDHQCGSTEAFNSVKKQQTCESELMTAFNQLDPQLKASPFKFWEGNSSWTPAVMFSGQFEQRESSEMASSCPVRVHKRNNTAVRRTSIGAEPYHFHDIRHRNQILRSSQPASNPANNVQHGALKGQYRSYLENAVSAERALPKCIIGAVELCTFFPNHTQWPSALLRLRRNGWLIKDIARIQLFARDRLQRDAVDKRNAALRHQIIKAGQEYFNNPNFATSKQPEMQSGMNDADATSWQPSKLLKQKLQRRSSTHFWATSLISCARGIVNWPQGNDVGLVTQCILYALQFNDQALSIKDIPALVQSQQFELPLEAGNCIAWDQHALARFRQTLWTSANGP